MDFTGVQNKVVRKEVWEEEGSSFMHHNED